MWNGFAKYIPTRLFQTQIAFDLYLDDCVDQQYVLTIWNQPPNALSTKAAQAPKNYSWVGEDIYDTLYTLKLQKNVERGEGERTVSKPCFPMPD